MVIVLRPAQTHLLDILGGSSLGQVVFQAPTGYGKTSLTPSIYRVLTGSNGPYRVIHSLPLRAIVEQAYKRFVEELGPDVSIGYQAHGLGLIGKSPFMTPDIVITTLDSLVLNITRFNVGERGLGHYEVPRASILTSLVIFDEAHLPFQDGRVNAVSSMLAVVNALTRLSTPILVETATLSDNILANLCNYMAVASEGPKVVEPVPPGYNPGRLGPCIMDPIEDLDFYERAAAVTWNTEATGDPIGKVLELTDSGYTVFRAVNSVSRAIEEYLRYKDSLDERVVLIHGRLTPGDRCVMLNRLSRAKVLIGTSAVEAGVDASFNILVTDPSGPESIIQRAGRVCRSLDCSDAKIFYTGRCDELCRKLSTVNPRIPLDYKGVKGYKSILNLYSQEPRTDIRLYNLLQNLILLPLSRYPVEKLIEELSRIACSLLRNQVLVPLIPHPEDVEADSVDDVVEDGQVIVVGNNTVYSMGDKWLERNGGGVKALFYNIKEHERMHPQELYLKEDTIELETLSSCTTLNKHLSKGLVGFMLKKGAYMKGVGLQ